MLPWLDAAFAPTAAQAASARAAGYVAIGYYADALLSGGDPYHTWSPSEVAGATQGGLVPLPILVPAPGLSMDPIAAANYAKTYLRRSVPILYDGPHLFDSGQIALPVWSPQPGARPALLDPGHAIQWADGVDMGGWTADLSVAAEGFPFDTGVVIDLEHAVAPGGWQTPQGRNAIAWYNTFHDQFAALPNPPPRPPLPGRSDQMNIYTCPGQPTFLVDGPIIVGLDQETVASLLNKPDSPPVWPVSPGVSARIAAIAAKL